MNIAHWLYQTARIAPAAPALFEGEQLRSTYGAFAARAEAIARWLTSQHGVSAGDRIAICMKNRVEYLELLYATWWLGAVAVPINFKLHPKEVAWILDNADAKIVFKDDGKLGEQSDSGGFINEITIDDGALAQIARHPPATVSPPEEVEDGALAWLFYTSGTTGRPKGVMLSHGNLISMSLCYCADVDPVEPADAALYAAPMSHGAGLYNFVHVRKGARHVVPRSRGFDAREILTLGESVGRLSFFAAPTMVRRLVREAVATSSHGQGIKTIVYGGGPMYVADIQEALAQLGPRFVQIYGQGESPMTITALSREALSEKDHPDWQRRLASVGLAQSCVELRIVDADMKNVPTGHTGEIVVRGPMIMSGYWRNPEATRDVLVDGWLRTGDVGHLDEDGFLHLTDRSKDIIISGGTNIYPREVEEILLTHPQVAEVAVVGGPDPEWGEQVVAFIVAEPGVAIDTAALDQWCRNEIASFKRPKRYQMCEELPKNACGKVEKTVLRRIIFPAA